jgi:hypothetical protein
MTPVEGLPIRAAGQRPFDPQHHLARDRLGNGNLTHFHSPRLDQVRATLPISKV